MEPAVETIFLWSIRDINSTVILPSLFFHGVADVLGPWVVRPTDSVAVHRIKSLLPAERNDQR